MGFLVSLVLMKILPSAWQALTSCMFPQSDLCLAAVLFFSSPLFLLCKANYWLVELFNSFLLEYKWLDLGTILNLRCSAVETSLWHSFMQWLCYIDGSEQLCTAFLLFKKRILREDLFSRREILKFLVLTFVALWFIPNLNCFLREVYSSWSLYLKPFFHWRHLLPLCHYHFIFSRLLK